MITSKARFKNYACNLLSTGELMMEKQKFIQYGFGPIGQRVASYAIDRGFELEAVIDSDPAKAGKNAGEILGKDLSVIIQDSSYDVFKSSKSNLVFLTTMSALEDAYPQILNCIHFKKNIVSTCEELSYPWKQNYHLSSRIDMLAKLNKVAVVGTGVNPGFAMDALPVFLSSICKDVESVRIERYQDASIRRLPFQKKIGAGCTLEEFDALVKEKKIRHVGFTESVQMIAKSLGWELEKIEETIEPVIAKKRVKSEFLKVPKGRVCGVDQICKGYMNGKEAITLELQAYLGHKKPHDAVMIKGEPNITSVVKGGINGDIATCAIAVNAAKKILESEPGLKTMLDLGLTSWYK